MSSYSHYSPSLSSSYFSSSTTRSSSPIAWWRRSSPSCSPCELTAIILGPKGCYEVPCDPYNEVFPNIYIGDGTTALCTSLLRSIGVTHVLNAACGKDRSLNLINTSKGFYRESGIKFLGIEAYDMPSFCLSPFFKEAADFIDDAIQNRGSNPSLVFMFIASLYPLHFHSSFLSCLEETKYGKMIFDPVHLSIFICCLRCLMASETHVTLFHSILQTGKVYVHCRMGISRSATLVLAYLMIKRDFSAQGAVRTVRRHREIIPNDGFLQQLCNLNEELIHGKSMQERRDRLTSSYGSKNISVT